MKNPTLGPWHLSFMAALALASAPAAAQTIATFDRDLSIGLNPSVYGGCPLETGYVGLQWTGFGCYSPWYTSPDLYPTWAQPLAGDYDITEYRPPRESDPGWVPGVAGAMNPGSEVFSNDLFDFNRAYVAANLRDGMSLSAWGYTSGVETYFRSFLIGAAAPTLLTFDFLGVDRVVFGWGEGGTISPRYSYASPTDTRAISYGFAIDNVVLNDPTVTPEPSTWIMLLTGLLGLGLVARRRRRGEDEDRSRRPLNGGAA